MVDYSTIIQRSFIITKRNRWLLVYGAMSGVFSAGSRYSQSFNWKENDSVSTPSYESATKVLGAETTNFFSWASNISAVSWITLGLVLILALGLFLAVRMLISSWSQSSLIYGIELAAAEKEVNLLTTSPTGRAFMKRFLTLGILSNLLFLGVVMGAVGVWGLIVFLLKASSFRIAWMIGGGILGVTTIIVCGILLWFGSIYGQRYIILHNKTAMEALKSGIFLFRKNLLASIVMNLINGVIISIIGLASALIVAVPFLIGYSSGKFNLFTVGVGATIFIVYIILAAIISAGLSVFSTSNWNLIFHKLSENEQQR